MFAPDRPDDRHSRRATERKGRALRLHATRLAQREGAVDGDPVDAGTIPGPDEVAAACRRQASRCLARSWRVTTPRAVR